MAPIALIVHARRSPHYLDLCLASLYGQSEGDFEVLVAESGGSDAHDEVVEHHARHLAQRVRHIHAPGSPQNQARALNAAVMSTQAEYVIFLGGDCLAQPDFVAGHLAGADYHHFVHGETLPLDDILTGAMESEALGSGLAFDEDWLRAISPEWHREHLETSLWRRLKQWLRKDLPGLRYWNCDSASCFRADLVAVNGFDMDVDDWRQDQDLANRLQNNGLEPVAAGPDGNVLQLRDPEPAPAKEAGGRMPAALAPGGEVRAVAGLEELAAGVAMS